MTKTLDTAFKAAKTLPESRQEELARWVMDVVVQDNSSAKLSPEQNEEVARRMAASEKPVSAEEATAFFQKFA